jgi:kumamolisin
VTSARGGGQRLTPDIAAVSDPFTGVKIVLNQQVVAGGGTSQAAPIWAGLAAVMTQYLVAHGGGPLGDLNPLLYRVATRSRLPAYHDVTLGGNAVDHAGPGYDLVTGLGTPDVNNLVQELLVVQAALR